MNNRRFSFVLWTGMLIAGHAFGASEVSLGVEESRPAAAATSQQSDASSLADADLLRRVQIANEDLYASLRSFVCDESILRTRENLAETKVRKLDTLTARVSFENGREQYMNVRQNNNSRSGLQAAGGAWSEGEFGTLLRQTQQLLTTQKVSFLGYGDQDGTPVALLRLEVSQEDSPWTLVVEGRSYRIPFRTDVAVEPKSGHILAVKRHATEIPPEVFISGIEWAIKMAPTNLAGSTWLLPAEGEYAVSYAASNRVERNHMSFGTYRRYGSEVSLRFDPIS